MKDDEKYLMWNHPAALPGVWIQPSSVTNSIIQVWMEGYAITGNQGTAQRIFEGEAKDFDDAIRQLNEKDIESYGKASAIKGGLLDGKTMKPLDIWTIWGCKLFDNEEDARKSFG